VSDVREDSARVRHSDCLCICRLVSSMIIRRIRTESCRSYSGVEREQSKLRGGILVGTER
jgi:hypothetical protein